MISTFICMLSLLSSVVSSPENTTPRDDLIRKLRYIADGYRACNSGPLHVQGRIFFEQKAREGFTVPENRIFSPRWLDFRYLESNGKWRYEQSLLTSPKRTSFIINDQQRLVNFAYNVVRIYPISQERERKRRLTDLYGDFSELNTENGFDNVGTAMETLIGKIRSGTFDQKDCAISLETSENGVFQLKVRERLETSVYEIDPRKGFNVIKITSRYPQPKYWTEQDAEFVYQEVDGRWVLSKASLKNIEHDIVVIRRLETTKMEVNFEVPPESFDVKSLHIPQDIYTLDYHFSPPLELNKGYKPDEIAVRSLADSKVAITEVARVNKKGEVVVAKHDAYVDHQKRSGQNTSVAELEQKAALPFSPSTTSSLLGVASILGLLLVIVLLLYTYMKRRAAK